MPPAFVLSQDQTLKFLSSHHATQPCDCTTQRKTSGADTCIFKRIWIRVKDIQASTCFILVTGAQRPPEPGAVARMSLHLSTMSKIQTKSGGQPTYPGSCVPGGRCPSMSATRTAVPEAPYRLGGRAYMEGASSGQREFCPESEILKQIFVFPYF